MDTEKDIHEAIGKTGLTSQEVAESREKYGVNVLSPAQRTPLWKAFLAKFRDPLIIILLVAGGLSIAISFYEYCGLGQSFSVFFEPIGIFVAIMLATGLAFLFEVKAEKEFRILNQVNDEEPVTVVRDGYSVEIPKRDVVVGDVVVLSTGNEIPADGILFQSTDMSVDESTLTGEPVACKSADPADADPDATFPTDRVLRGTKIMEGHGMMVVDAVGDATENGKVFEAAQIDDSVRTPLDEQLGRLGKLVSRMSYAVAVMIVIGRMLLYFANVDFGWISFLSYFLKTLMVAVTLIVVAVPEGLPMAVTLSLAYSMRRMLRTNNLVRKLHACETMGATTVICTDKTGTLTQNRMQVAHADFFGNTADEVVEEGIAVNSTARLDLSGKDPKPVGNPTEGALLLWLYARGKDYEAIRGGVRIVEEIPFSTERKYMATLVERRDGRRFLHVKGAPEIVHGMCGDGSGPDEDSLKALLAGYQNQAMRTLGFACKEICNGGEQCAADVISGKDLVFLGITAISDPVRLDVPEAVGEVLDAGIGIKVVTGDTPGTAKEIGRRIGLWDDAEDSDINMITGTEFAGLSDAELVERVKDLKIIARARPLDKKRLVEALQARGEVVAVTGDGTNDAPALKAAHVGLAMGDGTAVAKEAGDITIIDNSFTSIGRAVMWGRSLYRNIQRFILFQLTVNVVACLVVLLGAFMDMESPLTVTQMLWVNLIMDTFAAMALASLPPSEAVMRDMPRDRKSFIISRGMWRSIAATGAACFLVLIVLLYYFERTDIASLAEIGRAAVGACHSLTPYELSLFFTIFVFMQFWNMFNARAFATGRSALRLRGCRGFLFIVACIFVGQVLIVQFGGGLFNVVPLRLSDWLVIIGSTSLVLWAGEISRLIKRPA